MARIITHLDDQTFRRLIESAERDLRTIQQQAAWLLRSLLSDFVPDDLPDHPPDDEPVESI